MRETSRRAVIIGCGHMGLAIARGLLGDSSWEVVAVESDATRRSLLQEVDRLQVTDQLVLEADDVVVLAVPPQVFAEFAAAEGHHFSEATTVISVMAGLTADTIAAALGSTQVIRSIPNTPSEVFEGMTVFYAGPGVLPAAVDAAERLLGSIGAVLRVETEVLVDDATAICGGGPAFVSYIVDAFCQFALERGFSPAQSRTMATQVFGGTASLIEHSAKPPMQLCREVMTPNGTTERGIAAFEAASLRDSIHVALDASASRSRELAGVLSREVLSETAHA